VETHDIEELRRIIAECCQQAEAASEVALKALQKVEKEAKRRQGALRTLRGRLAVVEATLRQGRAR
jgi:hypothetical protein